MNRFRNTLLIMLLSLGFSQSLSAQVYQESRKYRVTAYKTGNNAITSLSNTVEVIPYMSVYIPNSFTPNGDGLNDHFGAYGEAIREFKLQVFNRWGQMIFETNNITTRWDGSFDGVKVPMGTYAYRMSAKGITGGQTEKNGTVTVVY